LEAANGDDLEAVTAAFALTQVSSVQDGRSGHCTGKGETAMDKKERLLAVRQ
jgi:hypothetical protein